MGFLKSHKKLALFLTTVILLAFAGYAFYFSQKLDHKPRAEMAMAKQTVFLSKNPAFDFSFEYPEGEWRPRESQGRKQKYDSLYLQGPIDKLNEFAGLIVLTVKPLEAGMSASDLLEAYLTTASNLKKFKILSRKSMSVGGEKAFAAICEQEMLLPREKLDAKPVQVRQSTIFLVRGDKSFEFSFIFTAAQYSIYKPVFEHILKTFKFKE